MMTYVLGFGFSRSFFGLGSSGSSVSELPDEMTVPDRLGLFQVRQGRSPTGSSNVSESSFLEEDASSSSSASSSTSSPFPEETREVPDFEGS